MPDASQRASGAVRSTEFRVRYAETDQMGVVYYANYLVWCEIGRTEFMRTLGRSYADLEREGVLLAVSDASLRYHAAARYDDLIRVETTLSSVRSRALEFEYVIVNAVTGARLVSARTSLVSLDRNGRPTPLPPDFRALLAPLG
jgi:acyl-CoA thioester hydrolase